MSTGFDIEKIELGRKLIEITGNPYAYNDDVKHESQTIASLAIEDIVTGCKHLKGEYYGNKQYAGFYQRCDCRYHYGPTYGTIVDEIGLNVRDRELTPEEVEAAVYYIKVYPEIKSKAINMNESCFNNQEDFTIYHPLKNGKGEYECIPYSFYGSLTSFSEDKDLIDFLHTCFYTKEECQEWIEKHKEQNSIINDGQQECPYDDKITLFKIATILSQYEDKDGSPLEQIRDIVRDATINSMNIKL